jgi:putative Mg2+ transporter-C (MgtC) family protein
MLDIFSAQQMEIVGQLVLAVLLGSLLGIERTLAHRMAGFRTFAMVSLGACVFTVISVVLLGVFGSSVNYNPFFIPAQIVTGIGFLAAGLIILDKEQVHGLTTSAGLWVAAAVGMAVGFKLYIIAIATTVLAILIFGLFWQLEQKIVRNERK